MPSVRSVILSAAAASVAMAETIVVKVGQDGNTFDPQMVEAAEGDVVEFQFWPKNHSVVAGSMTEGCMPLGNNEGFYSGYMPVAEGMGDMVFQVTIENTDPWVFYCSQGMHCQNGMYGMINGNDTALEAYGSLAQAATQSMWPGVDAFGGEVMEADMEGGEGGDDPESGAGALVASMGMSFAAVVGAILLS